MSQFGSKNPAAWARPTGAGQQLNTSLFQNPLIGGQAFGGVTQMGMSGMINAAAFSQQAAANMGMNLSMLQAPQQAIRMQSAQQQQSQQKSRTFSGVVTKMHDNYGFIDDEVFFQVSVVRGTLPRTGDRVMAEATYNPTMPFKWNAYRVQLVSMPRGRSPPQQRRRSPPRAVMTTIVGGNGRRPSPARRSSPRNIVRRTSPKRGSPRRLSPGRRLKRSPASSLRNKSPSLKRDGNSLRGSASPPRRRARIIPRYQCHNPKAPICSTSSSIQNLVHIRRRYPNAYIPSDFVLANVDWPVGTPIDNPISFSTNAIIFHVLHKDLDCPDKEVETIQLAPADLDPRFSAKVILMSHSGLNAIHQKAFGLLPDGSLDESVDPISLSRCISFLVGSRGKGEVMALGGSWSPSLDGPNPDEDAQVLVRTAIRTVRALTGIDLTGCERWYKLAQLRYYRAEKGRLDTTVLLLPDTSGLMPSDDDYQQIEAVLKNQLATKISEVEALAVEPLLQPGESGESGVGGGHSSAATTVDSSKEQIDEVHEEDDEEDDLQPTHWAGLDVKAMKVAELRQELMARDLETKGIKSVLCSRLQEALDKEKAKEEGGQIEEQEEDEETREEENPNGEVVEVKEETKKLSEEEKKAIEKLEKEKIEKIASLERHYTIPKETGIFVFPNKHAKSGRFDCKVVSLHSLLEYRSDDCKEHSFELAVFAEAISEMLDRSMAFEVYKSLSRALDAETEKQRRDDAKVAEVIGVEDGIKDIETEGANKIEKSEDEKKKDDEKREEDKKKIIAETRKTIVVDRNAFQAFAHFDQNLCGYLLEKDIEEILFTMALNISRGYISKLIKKCSVRDRVNYRQLTDSWVNKDGTVTYSPGVLPDAPDSTTLAKGFSLPQVCLGALTSAQTEKSVGAAPDVSNSGVVVFHGALMDIQQMMEKVSQMEHARNTEMQKVQILESQLKEGSKLTQSLDKKKKRLEEDVEKYRKRLHDAEKCLKNSVDDTVMMKAAVQDFRKVGERIIAMAEKILPTPKEKEDEKSIEKEDKEVKKDKREDRDEKKVFKKEKKLVEENPKLGVNGAAEEKKELTLVDEVEGEPVEMDTIVLEEEFVEDDKMKQEVESVEPSDPVE